MCKPPQLPSELFLKLQHLPDPTPGQDGPCKKFDEVLETETIEENRRSLQKITSKRLLFYPSIQLSRTAI